ncbi:MAG TPA: hypothetical protein VJZ02_00510 [Candidatus Brocadiales bacterium]|nr:hypothetical protein [Candidatus Brocadiales bacterium]
MKKTFLLLVVIVTLCLTEAEAYMEEYPPFPFKSKKLPPHLETKGLIEFKGETTTRVEDLQVELSTIDVYDKLRIKDGKEIIFETEEGVTPFVFAVYYADLDNNKLKDIVIFSDYRSCGLGYKHRVDILFQVRRHTFSHIHYDTMCAGLEDFVDMDRDGVYEVIYADFYGVGGHHYFVYNIYEIKEAGLHNANKKYAPAFPKFIWFTYKPNDKQSTRITREEKEEYLKIRLPEVIRDDRDTRR